MKNVYLLVTDLHYAVSKEHRKDYLNEVTQVLLQIIDLRDAYIRRGYSPKLIFLGDVIDGAITNPDNAMRCQNLFRFLCSLFTSTYCVMGNHEANNVVSNPFWFLVSRLDDPALNSIPKPLQPQGVETVFTVPAIVSDGEVSFYFNHYGTSPKVPEKEGISIGLFHQNVGSNEITKMWGAFTDVEAAPYMHSYDYAFFGHMHLAEGKYKIGNCVAEWLGSCVGTNVTEVQQLPSKCNIPAVLVEDGVFVSVEDNHINRSDPKECIDFTKLQLTMQTKETAKHKQELAADISTETSLYNRIRQVCENHQLGFLLDMLAGSYEFAHKQYREGMEHILLGQQEREEDSSVT